MSRDLKPSEVEQRRDEALRRAMNTPPTPHKPKRKGAGEDESRRPLPGSSVSTKSQSTTSGLLRRINRSAVVGLIRREGVVTPSSLAAQLKISIATVMRVIHDLIREDLVTYDGHDESARGRPPARVKFRGAAHAIVGVEASRGEFYGAVSDLNGRIQTEVRADADDDGVRNVQRLIGLINQLLSARRPKGQTINGIGIGVPSIVRQPSGEVVLTLGLGWRELPLRQLIANQFNVPVYVENGRNLAAVGEWGFGAGRGASSVVSLAIGPGAGAGILIDGKLYGGRSRAAGELAWFLDDPMLTGRTFKYLGSKQSLRFGGGISESAILALEKAGRCYRAGTLPLDDLESKSRDSGLSIVKDLLDYATMAVASISAFMNPEVVVLAGQLARGGDLVVDALRRRLDGNVYDPPRLVISDLGHRDVVMGAVMLVLDATTLNPSP